MSLHVLVIEDGHEYSTTLRRFLPDTVHLVRAGDGFEALRLLAAEDFEVIFLDMRFDRVAPDQLLGDKAAALTRNNGDEARALRFLEDNQGAYVLAGLRDAGHRIPVVFSYDFDGEPRRWQHMAKAFGPLRYLTDNATPEQILEALSSAAET